MAKDIRRIIYASEATGDPAIDLFPILATSRANNGIDGITGILWSTGRRYIQVLEGPEASVIAAFVRIARDPRHTGIELIRDEHVGEREFGDWAMAAMPGERPDDARDRLGRMLANCSPQVAAAFAEAA